MKALERVKTGIKGFDELIEGGIPKGSSILIAGSSGTGKSILSMQYLFMGAKQFQEPGVFVTIESNVHTISWDLENFNWDIRAMQDKNLMSIYRIKPSDNVQKKFVIEKIESELNAIEKKVKEINAKRLVIDSTTALGTCVAPGNFRSMLFKFIDRLKDFDCTTILTTETKNLKNSFSAFGVEEFLVDGVVVLYFTPPHRSMFVRKMRGTNHDKNVHPFEITTNGIEIKHKEQILWEAIK